MIGRKVLHYQITEKLGEGGMGVVYKAEDTKLNRTVALKFLSTHIVSDPAEQQRLIHEARAAAGLHHPNICTIYEINEYNGQTFIAMAYVDGVTLRDKVLSGKIAIDEALVIAKQITEGINQAHKSGFVHRDIKSANIMVDRSGRAMIMDFGLAKKPEQAKPDDTFSSAGTSAYMAPEQARGEAADQRTDIWSIGIVLYEMLAGQLPFRGDYVQAVMYSILNEEPKDLAHLREDVPGYIVDVVAKCMAKDPDARYQTVEELQGVLSDILEKYREKTLREADPDAGRRRKSWFVSVPIAAVAILVGVFFLMDLLAGDKAASHVKIPIAVIDFNNETDETALDGLSGMLITSLEQSRRLSVMTRTRMFDVLKNLGRGDVQKIDESIGQELCLEADVHALVIPTIRKFGDLYTIDLKVLDTERNRYIFTAKEEGRGQESIPGMIDKIARNIRIDLKENTEVVQANAKSVTDVTTVSLDAYKQYFEGEQMLNNLDFKGAGKAYQKAVELDSMFALAYYRLAYTQWWWRDVSGAALKNINRALELVERIPKKEQYLAKALHAGITEGFAAQTQIYREMRKTYPFDKEMLFGLADSEFHTSNYDSAQVHFKKVLEIDPGFERALQHLTWAYMRTDQLEEAVEVARRWVDVDKSAESYKYLGEVLFLKGDTEAAVKQFQNARDVSPEKSMASVDLAAVYLSTGEVEKSIAELQAIINESSEVKDKLMGYTSLGMGVYPYQGRYELALATMEDALRSVLSAEKADSTLLVNLIVQKAELRYWGWGDNDAIESALAELRSFPEKDRGKDYQRGVGVLEIFAGDTASAAQDLREAKQMKVAAKLFDVLKHALSGGCDQGQKILDDALSGDPEMHFVAEETLAPFRYALAGCEVDNGRNEQAIKNLEKIVGTRALTLNSALVIPKSYYLLGKAYEATGASGKAAKSYHTFLEIWKDADPDLPEITDAKTRLDALKAAGIM